MKEIKGVKEMIIEYPKPTKTDKNGGWSISTDFLRKVDNYINEHMDCASMQWEDIEAVLIAGKHVMEAEK